MQEAAWYENVAILMLFLAGLCATAAFFLELRSYFIFNDWLQGHTWTEYSALRNIVEWFTEAWPLVFFVFGIVGIASLFMTDDLSAIVRIIFLVLAFPMLLLPIIRGEYERLSMITVFVVCYLLFRWLSRVAKNQRPRDWKIIVAEMRRLNLGPEEFILALLKGTASDGRKLAVMVPPGKYLSEEENIRGKIADLLQRGAHGEIKTVSLPTYSLRVTALQLRLKQKYPRAARPIDCLERYGISAEERAVLVGTLFYLHPEIADRVQAIIGN